MTCRKCGGTGRWQYDHNHTQPCPDCCPHQQGVWWLDDGYAPWQQAGPFDRWCCLAGCGTTWAGITDYKNATR